LELTIEYTIGQIVYLITDPDGLDRIVVAVLIEEGSVRYKTMLGAFDSWHNGFEIAPSLNIINSELN
tara:strand:- start:280 stop:480 length:201 start_codon:yes stop_codon:yes gene_type:complete